MPDLVEVRLVGGPLDGSAAWIAKDLGDEVGFASIGDRLAVSIGISVADEDRFAIHHYRRTIDRPSTFEFVPAGSGW